MSAILALWKGYYLADMIDKPDPIRDYASMTISATHRRLEWGALVLGLVLALTSRPCGAAEPSADSLGVRTRYGPHGLEVESEDGRFGAWFGLRAQLRYSYPFDDDPIEPGDFSATDEHELAIRRARLKSGGHAYGLRLEYYVEYELQNSALLDLRFTLTHSQPLAFRVGQWKAEYNRERRDSSGEQQFVERSIVNYVFTIDRQPGMMLFGRLFPGERIDSRYFLAVLSGAGRGNSDNEGTPMWLARYQWNFCGRDLPFSQSDVELREDVAGSLAVAGVINRSRFTLLAGGRRRARRPPCRCRRGLRHAAGGC